MSEEKENKPNVVENILNETDPNKLNDLVDLFNANQTKKNIARIDKYSNILDSISSEMLERFNNRSNSFSNKDLLEWLETLQNIVSKTDKSTVDISTLTTPLIQQNNQININTTLSRESKERVLDAIKSIMQSSNKSDVVVEEGDNKNE